MSQVRLEPTEVFRLCEKARASVIASIDAEVRRVNDRKEMRGAIARALSNDSDLLASAEARRKYWLRRISMLEQMSKLGSEIFLDEGDAVFLQRWGQDEGRR